MSIRKRNDGRWHVDVRPTGEHGKRYRKAFRTRNEAVRWESWILTEKTKNPEWEPPRKDTRRMLDLCELWHITHGSHLKDQKRIGKLRKLCLQMGNPIFSEFTPETFLALRTAKAKENSASTLNHDLTYLKAMFNELKRQGQIKDNPLKDIRPLKTDDPELTYLDETEIKHLIESLKARRNQDTLIIAKICLATGARWSEAEQLERKQVKKHAITYAKTKNGKSRTVPITADLYREIMNGRESGRLFLNSYDSFTNALNDSGVVLPKGQRTHVLRHTFASHFVMNGGNILTLQKILGHQSIAMTMRYAHLAPDHLKAATELNPITALKI